MSNTKVVLDFIDDWNRMAWDDVMAALTEDVVYHNIPMQELKGKEAAAGFILGMKPKSVAWEVLNIAENGNKVLTERVDRFVLEGDKSVALPVMGIFEIKNNKICTWRDYFDLNTFVSQMA
ncbi:MAG: nuclear transport factor 2 family protein [Pseudomonadales bacterium]|nr:nuclear transport factor 2 family protein [Pseudomonadales bacterium]